MSNSILKIDHLNKNFGRTSVLKDISLELFEGEVVSILGESGCGKSTLLGSIAGFFGINSGEIYLHNVKVAAKNFYMPPKKRNVGILFQDYALFPHLNVTQNILFGIEHLNKKEQQKRFTEMVDTLGLQDLLTRYPHELSGGQAQRVALARSIAPRPALILFDEPFSNLNHTLSQKMRQDIKRILKEHHLSAILVTHDREDAFYLSNRIVLMEKGEILAQGEPKSLYYAPNNMQVAQFLGAVNVISEQEMNQVNDPSFQAWLISKKGLIRPKDFKLTDQEKGICATVLESHFFGDWYEVLVQIEHLQFFLYLPEAFNRGECLYLDYKTSMSST